VSQIVGNDVFGVANVWNLCVWCRKLLELTCLVSQMFGIDVLGVAIFCVP